MEDERRQAEGEHSLNPSETWGQGGDRSLSDDLGGDLGSETGGRSGRDRPDETPDGLGGLREEPLEPAPPRIEDQPEGRTDDAGSGIGRRGP